MASPLDAQVVAARLAAIEETSGSDEDIFAADYLDLVRQDWPD